MLRPTHRRPSQHRPAPSPAKRGRAGEGAGLEQDEGGRQQGTGRAVAPSPPPPNPPPQAGEGFVLRPAPRRPRHRPAPSPAKRGRASCCARLLAAPGAVLPPLPQSGGGLGRGLAWNRTRGGASREQDRRLRPVVPLPTLPRKRVRALCGARLSRGSSRPSNPPPQAGEGFMLRPAHRRPRRRPAPSPAKRGRAGEGAGLEPDEGGRQQGTGPAVTPGRPPPNPPPQAGEGFMLRPALSWLLAPSHSLSREAGEGFMLRPTHRRPRRRPAPSPAKRGRAGEGAGLEPDEG